MDSTLGGALPLRRADNDASEVDVDKASPRRPEAAAPPSSLHRCGFPPCLAEGKLRCSACKTAFYCSRKHQRSAWRAHKPACRAACSGAGTEAASIVLGPGSAMVSTPGETKEEAAAATNLATFRVLCNADTVRLLLSFVRPGERAGGLGLAARLFREVLFDAAVWGGGGELVLNLQGLNADCPLDASTYDDPFGAGSDPRDPCECHAHPWRPEEEAGTARWWLALPADARAKLRSHCTSLVLHCASSFGVSVLLHDDPLGSDRLGQVWGRVAAVHVVVCGGCCDEESGLVDGLPDSIDSFLSECCPALKKVFMELPPPKWDIEPAPFCQKTLQTVPGVQDLLHFGEYFLCNCRWTVADEMPAMSSLRATSDFATDEVGTTVASQILAHPPSSLMNLKCLSATMSGAQGDAGVVDNVRALALRCPALTHLFISVDSIEWYSEGSEAPNDREDRVWREGSDAVFSLLPNLRQVAFRLDDCELDGTEIARTAGDLSDKTNITASLKRIIGLNDGAELLLYPFYNAGAFMQAWATACDMPQPRAPPNTMG